MNYEKIYLDLCNYCKQTTPKERLQKRNPKDQRLQKDSIYTETHHILPRSLGGSDHESNLVTFLPEEHLIAHQIRWKAYRDREDFVSVRLIINGFNNPGVKSVSTEPFSGKFLSVYGWFRQNISDFRRTNGWQTESGIKSISNHRKGKIPGRCTKTGIILGEFDVNDPRVLSGEIVHHSKGRMTYYNPETGHKIHCRVEERPDGYIPKKGDSKGEKNSRYSGITDSEITEFVDRICEIFISNGITYFPSMRFIIACWNNTHEQTFPSLCGGLRSGFRFGGDLETNLISPISKKYGMQRITIRKYFNQELIKKVTDDYNRIFG